MNTEKVSPSRNLQKIVLKCSKCGKEIATFYSKAAIIDKTLCKSCYQLNKLIE